MQRKVYLVSLTCMLNPLIESAKNSVLRATNGKNKSINLRSSVIDADVSQFINPAYFPTSILTIELTKALCIGFLDVDKQTDLSKRAWFAQISVDGLVACTNSVVCESRSDHRLLWTSDDIIEYEIRDLSSDLQIDIFVIDISKKKPLLNTRSDPSPQLHQATTCNPTVSSTNSTLANLAESFFTKTGASSPDATSILNPATQEFTTQPPNSAPSSRLYGRVIIPLGRLLRPAIIHSLDHLPSENCELPILDGRASISSISSSSLTMELMVHILPHKHVDAKFSRAVAGFPNVLVEVGYEHPNPNAAPVSLGFLCLRVSLDVAPPLMHRGDPCPATDRRSEMPKENESCELNHAASQHVENNFDAPNLLVSAWVASEAFAVPFKQWQEPKSFDLWHFDTRILRISNSLGRLLRCLRLLMRPFHPDLKFDGHAPFQSPHTPPVIVISLLFWISIWRFLSACIKNFSPDYNSSVNPYSLHASWWFLSLVSCIVLLAGPFTPHAILATCRTINPPMSTALPSAPPSFSPETHFSPDVPLEDHASPPDLEWCAPCCMDVSRFHHAQVSSPFGPLLLAFPDIQPATVCDSERQIGFKTAPLLSASLRTSAGALKVSKILHILSLVQSILGYISSVLESVSLTPKIELVSALFSVMIALAIVFWFACYALAAAAFIEIHSFSSVSLCVSLWLCVSLSSPSCLTLKSNLSSDSASGNVPSSSTAAIDVENSQTQPVNTSRTEFKDTQMQPRVTPASADNPSIPSTFHSVPSTLFQILLRFGRSKPEEHRKFLMALLPCRTSISFFICRLRMFASLLWNLPLSNIPLALKLAIRHLFFTCPSQTDKESRIRWRDARQVDHENAAISQLTNPVSLLRLPHNYQYVNHENEILTVNISRSKAMKALENFLSSDGENIPSLIDLFSSSTTQSNNIKSKKSKSNHTIINRSNSIQKSVPISLLSPPRAARMAKNSTLLSSPVFRPTRQGKLFRGVFSSIVERFANSSNNIDEQSNCDNNLSADSDKSMNENCNNSFAEVHESKSSEYEETISSNHNNNFNHTNSEKNTISQPASPHLNHFNNKSSDNTIVDGIPVESSISLPDFAISSAIETVKTPKSLKKVSNISNSTTAKAFGIAILNKIKKLDFPLNNFKNRSPLKSPPETPPSQPMSVPMPPALLLHRSTYIDSPDLIPTNTGGDNNCTTVTTKGNPENALSNALTGVEAPRRSVSASSSVRVRGSSSPLGCTRASMNHESGWNHHFKAPFQHQNGSINEQLNVIANQSKLFLKPPLPLPLQSPPLIRDSSSIEHKYVDLKQIPIKMSSDTFGKFCKAAQDARKTSITEAVIAKILSKNITGDSLALSNNSNNVNLGVTNTNVQGGGSLNKNASATGSTAVAGSITVLNQAREVSNESVVSQIASPSLAACVAPPSDVSINQLMNGWKLKGSSTSLQPICLHHKCSANINHDNSGNRHDGHQECASSSSAMVENSDTQPQPNNNSCVCEDIDLNTSLFDALSITSPIDLSLSPLPSIPGISSSQI